MNTMKKFRLDEQVAVITGGAGLLGVKHAEAIAEAGGIPVLWDINEKAAIEEAQKIATTHGVAARGIQVDITSINSIKNGHAEVLDIFNHVDILINNAANDPKVSNTQDKSWSRFENISLEIWDQDIGVGLTGAFLSSQVVGFHMAQNKGGIILNIASDLSVIAPDQRLYRTEGLSDEKQPVKAVTYSVIKHGLLGLTRYLATYWAHKNIRVNALSPGGVYTEQPVQFVKRLTELIPMGRMAFTDEYKSAVVFLCSDASSYMTGQNVIIDGGRTVL